MQKLYLYKGLCTLDNYYQFFNSNLCHVGKRNKTDISNELICEQFGMIFYCDMTHRDLYRSQHRSICISIQKCLAEESLRSQMLHCVNLFVWVLSKRKLMDPVKMNLGREVSTSLFSTIWGILASQSKVVALYDLVIIIPYLFSTIVQ